MFAVGFIVLSEIRSLYIIANRRSTRLLYWHLTRIRKPPK
jgi:hypothetical protein